MGGDYRAEVALRMNCSYEDLDIRLEGRADGIFTEDEVVWIDEIKGIYGNVEQMEEPVKVHEGSGYVLWLYLRCSGRLVEDWNPDDICQSGDRSGEKVPGGALHRGTAKNGTRNFWMNIINGSVIRKNGRKREIILFRAWNFHFPTEKVRRKMVSSVYHAIGASRQIFIQAPTGVGKTMSTIFPAVRAVGEGKGETIFYLTAKTITRTVAQEALEVLREKGMKYKVVTITAKRSCVLWTKPNVIRYIVLTPGDISTGSMTLSMSCGRRRADMTGDYPGAGREMAGMSF
ncbi:MAG: DEAD/DEAH box helicase [Ruminococcus sp.]